MEIDNVNHPPHYTEGFACRPVECIDITRGLPFSMGNAFKYVWRAGKKGDAVKAKEDLDKARWYLRDVDESEDHHLCTAQVAAIRASRRIFELIVPDGSARYEALKAILEGDGYAAFRFIDAMEYKFVLNDPKGVQKDERA
jgi:hypothetical protein